jgi:DNA-binding winged helix-turn-helix (wHTH) protein
MKLPSDAPRTVRFGVFELDLQTGELRRKGVKAALQEQPFRVLAMLVMQPGELLTRDALRRAVWPEAVFVDFDHGLNKAVAKIRDALGDLAESPRYVETLERRGYRFIAPVEVVVPRVAPALSGGDQPVVARLSLVSRLHARIVVSESSVTIEDLGSRNGTFVNGRRLDALSPLASGDEVRIGPDRLVVFTASAIDSTSVVREE